MKSRLVSFRQVVADPGEEVEIDKWEFVDKVTFEEGKFRLIIQRFWVPPQHRKKKVGKSK